MNAGWDFENHVKMRIMIDPRESLPKYIIADDRDEFVRRYEEIVKRGFEQTGDNLKYLEGLEKLKEVKAGAKIEDVFPWIKESKEKYG